MANDQVVVITGKKCSGKSELAKQLNQQYGYLIVPSKKKQFQNTNDSSTKCQDESGSLLDAVRETISGPGTKVVVDSLCSYDEVLQFRRYFGEKLIHVHLYASDGTLESRYLKLAETGAPSYGQIENLRDTSVINSLKNDADVRIYTERSDPADTLVRVAARLQLYSSPDIKCVDVVVGAQFGSEGKGNVVAFLAREYDVLVRVGGPNAGHTVTGVNGQYTYHHLPSGARDVKARILLGPGMTIRLSSLLKEIQDCEITPHRLFIDPQATIIETRFIRYRQRRLISEIFTICCQKMTRADPFVVGFFCVNYIVAFLI